MVAELVENGLAFSPPDVDVEIQGRMLPGRYLIGITDQGLGMDPEEMARANARLRGEESFLSAPTRYLGHYVVGHLARQMGVDVEITPSPVTGVTARVVLSAAVLTTPPAFGPYPEVHTNGVRPTRPYAPMVSGGPPLAIDAITADDYVDRPVRPCTAARRRTRERPLWRTDLGQLPALGRPQRSHPMLRPWNAVPHRCRPGQRRHPDGHGRSAASGTRADRTVDPNWTLDPRPCHPRPGSRQRHRRGRGPRPRRAHPQRTDQAVPPAPAAAPGPAPVPAEPVAEVPSTEAADAVRTRLTTLRAGIARGEHDHAAGAERPVADPGSTSETGSEAERSPHAR